MKYFVVVPLVDWVFLAWLFDSIEIKYLVLAFACFLFRIDPFNSHAKCYEYNAKVSYLVQNMLPTACENICKPTPIILGMEYISSTLVIWSTQ